MNKHPGLMRLGADIAKDLERELALRADTHERFDGERVSGPVTRVDGDREEDSRHHESGAHRRPSESRKETSRRGASRRLRPQVSVAIGALALAAAFALGVLGDRELPVKTPTSQESAASTSAGLSFSAVGADGSSASPALGALVSETGSPVAVAFSDGSRVSLEPKAEARVVRTTSRGATVLLERGRLAASVVHRSDTEWAFDAGPYEVRVVGTAFDLAWDPRRDALTLHMTEGRVTVKGCGSTESVGAGQDLTLACDMDMTPPAPAMSAAPVSPPAPMPEGGGQQKDHALDHARDHEEQSAHASDARPSSLTPVAGASVARPPISPPETPLETMDAATLWTTADTARAAGDAATAKTSLLVFRRRFRGDPRAATAAFLLGTLAYDVENARAEGLGWFSIYLAENPNGALSREALGRAMEASVALGKTDDAQRFARRYLDTHRGGPHTELATRVLGGQP